MHSTDFSVAWLKTEHNDVLFVVHLMVGKDGGRSSSAEDPALVLSHTGGR
jgi:hypothetical protein